ncbi:TetR/AcrR family transcriptional regulator [Corynebacterium sp.]|uniref:TetR/AcrR family transcriptional regulator n=1 Tax=Corynebacterium sp. TaxID=1720 RepID=UPI003735CF52
MSDTPESPAPSAREKIIRATLDTIAREGLEGTTMRRVALNAGLSVGAITHHFPNREALLIDAMNQYTDDTVERFNSYFEDVHDLQSAREAVVQLLSAPARSRLDMVVGSELYTISLRRPRFRLLLDRWTRASRDIMLRYFTQDSVYIIDALYEGLLLHRRMNLGEYTDDLITAAVESLTPPEKYIGPTHSS